MLIRTNMEDMREKTHTRHYELYRQKRLEQMGFTDVDSDNKPVSMRFALVRIEAAIPCGSNNPTTSKQLFVFFATRALFRFHFSKHSKQNVRIIWLNCRAKKTKCVKCSFFVLKRRKLNSKKAKKM